MNKLPPQNIEAEESILSAVLIWKKSHEVFDILNPSDFYKTAHRIIYSTCKKLYADKIEIDLISLTSKLKSDSNLKKSGGSAFIAGLLDIPIPSSIKQTSKLIKDAAIKRQTIEVAYNIIENCHNSNGDIVGLLDRAQTEICKIEPFNQKSTFTKISESITQTTDRYELLKGSGGISGISSGYHDLDRITAGFQKSNLIILAGRPSMGKSSFAINCAAYMSKFNVAGAVFSLEMSNEELTDKCFSIESGILSTKFRTGDFNNQNWIQISDAAGKISNWPLILDDTSSLSIQEFKRRARLLKKQEDIKYIFIDYLQLMRGEKGVNRDLEIGSITRGLKSLAKDLNIPIIALSQLNRGLESRDNKKPRMSDLRESGNIEQDADVILFIYRDEVYHKDTEDKGIAEINIAKQRVGPTGTVKVHWNPKTTKFSNLEYQYKEYQPQQKKITNGYINK